MNYGFGFFIPLTGFNKKLTAFAATFWDFKRLLDVNRNENNLFPKNRMIMKIDLKANEVVLKATDSEYFLPGQSVAGKLILTNQRVYFRTLNGNGKEYNMEFMPGQLREILPFNRGWFSKNGLTLVTREGKELKFLMKKRDEWGTALNRLC